MLQFTYETADNFLKYKQKITNCNYTSLFGIFLPQEF